MTFSTGRFASGLTPAATGLTPREGPASLALSTALTDIARIVLQAMLPSSTSSDSFRLPCAFYSANNTGQLDRFRLLDGLEFLEERGKTVDVLTSRVVCCEMDEAVDSFDVESLLTGFLWRRKGNGAMTRRRSSTAPPRNVHVSKKAYGARCSSLFPIALSGTLATIDVLW